MRIFTLPPAAGSNTEPNFYDSLQKVRLRQQLEMYSLGEHGCPGNTNKTTEPSNYENFLYCTSVNVVISGFKII